MDGLIFGSQLTDSDKRLTHCCAFKFNNLTRIVCVTWGSWLLLSAADGTSGRVIDDVVNGAPFQATRQMADSYFKNSYII